MLRQQGRADEGLTHYQRVEERFGRDAAPGVRERSYAGGRTVRYQGPDEEFFARENAAAPSTRVTQYFEILGNRAIYHDGWIASTTPPVPPWANASVPRPSDVMHGYAWELYNLADDLADSTYSEPEVAAWIKESIDEEFKPILEVS